MVIELAHYNKGMKKLSVKQMKKEIRNLGIGRWAGLLLAVTLLLTVLMQLFAFEKFPGLLQLAGTTLVDRATGESFCVTAELLLSDHSAAAADGFGGFCRYARYFHTVQCIISGIKHSGLCVAGAVMDTVWHRHQNVKKNKYIALTMYRENQCGWG